MSAALAASPEPRASDGLTGTQRVAILLMLLGDEHGKPIWSEFDDGEVKRICLAMTDLGAVHPDAVTDVMNDFIDALGGGAAVSGGTAAAEELLSKVFPADRVTAIMADVKGASGRQVWKRLASVPPDILTAFLRNEYPQTIAVILSRMGGEAGGQVLGRLPDALAIDVVTRILKLDEVSPEALEDIEEMLHREFLSGGGRKPKRDPYETMADRFNAFDRATETRMLAALEALDRDAALRIREKMFTFDDVLKLDAAGVQTLLRSADKDVLARALKGAKEETVAVFTGNMSSRAAKNFADDLEAMAPLRMKDVEEAQGRIVRAAKTLADAGEIRVAKGRDDEDMV